MNKKIEGKCLFLFDSKKTVNKKIVDRIIREEPDSCIVVLEENMWRFDLKLPVRTISDYYDLRLLGERVDEVCTSILSFLFKDTKIKSAFTINGIFFLKLIREHLGVRLSNIVKKILVIRLVISEEKPSRIVVFEDQHLLSPTLPPTLGKIVSSVVNKHDVHVSIKSSFFSRWVISIKRVMLSLFFLRQFFKIYTCIRIKTLFRHMYRRKSKNDNENDDRLHKIIMLPYSYAEKISVKPVVEELSKYSSIICLGIRATMEDMHANLFENLWKKKKDIIPVVSVGEYSLKWKSEEKKMYQTFMRVWEQKKNFFYKSEALNFYGLGLGELLKDTLELLLKWDIKECVNYLSVTREMLKKERPSLVIFTASIWKHVKSVMEVVEKQGIPSVAIQHGTYSDSYLWSPVSVTKICADEVFRDILLKRGEDPRKIIVTGAPKYDDLFRRMEMSKSSIKKHLGLKQNKRYMCLLTSFLPEWSTPARSRDLLTVVVKSLKEINYDLIIKLHPREDKDKVERLAREVAKSVGFEGNVTVFEFGKGDPLFDVVLASEFIVCVRTSAMLAALIAKKPTILINFVPYVGDFYPGVDDEIFGVARSHAELFEMMSDLGKDLTKARESVRRGEEYARRYVPYKNATSRVVGHILKLINSESE